MHKAKNNALQVRAHTTCAAGLYYPVSWQHPDQGKRLIAGAVAKTILTVSGSCLQDQRACCFTQCFIMAQVKQYVPEIMKAVVSLPEQQVCGAIGLCSAADLSGACNKFHHPSACKPLGPS